MLEGLRKYNDFGSEEDIIYFFTDIIADKKISERDIRIIVSNIPGKIIIPDAMFDLGMAFSILQYDKETQEYSMVKKYVELISDTNKFRACLLNTVVDILFESNIVTNEHFEYDDIKQRIRFRNEVFTLHNASFRNLLVSIGLLEIKREMRITNFYIRNEKESEIEKQLKSFNKKISLLQLKKSLEENEITGEKAELYVLEYENEGLVIRNFVTVFVKFLV